jgi:hypothetical protein
MNAMNTASKQTHGFSIFARLFHLPFKLTVLFSCLICIGCATTNYKAIPPPPNLPENARVLLMPLDVQLFELTAGGLQEPKADWTAAAENHVHTALEKFLAQKKDTVLRYEPLQDNPEKSRMNQQMMKLHETVGNSIMIHTYFAGFNLPTKKEQLDWSLGEGVQRINERYDANAALFIFIRDSYASPGRKAAMVLGALAGISITGGFQTGFASLVDLQTGNILWFGRLFRQTGDLRTPEPAYEAVSQLLFGIPL